MKFIALVATALSLSTVASAMDAERGQPLFDVLEQSMQCEVLAAYSRNFSEAERLREVATRAGWEIGAAMIADELDTSGIELPRCARHFKVFSADNWDDISFALAVGFELGELRSCAHELLLSSGDLSAEAEGEDVLLDEEWARRVQERTSEFFNQRNCGLIRLP